METVVQNPSPDIDARGSGDSRSARKRQAIVDAASTLFLRDGYLATSMDEFAALASVSKQTVYKQFIDKQSLFRDVVTAIVDEAGAPVVAEVSSLPTAATWRQTSWIWRAARWPAPSSPGCSSCGDS